MISVSRIRVLLGFAVATLVVTATQAGAQSLDTPMTRMRPIGSPSAVDRYLRPQATSSATTSPAPQAISPVRQAGYQSASYQSPVRQTVMMQSTPMALPANPPAGVASQSVLVNNDAQPIPQPQLNNQFATINNCALVTPPSGYSAASGCGCGSTIVPQSYNMPVSAAVVADPAATVPMATVPAEVAVPVATTTVPTNAKLGMPMRSLVTFGQENKPVTVGQGVVGQPVAYVPGQPIRNWIRYFMP